MNRNLFLATGAIGLLLLTACGGGGGYGGGGGGGGTMYTVGGTVTGLTGSGLVLANNAGNDLPIAAAGAFTFSASLASGAAYAVTVITQPSSPTQNCVVSNGSGTVGTANVANLAVVCTTVPMYVVGGTVTGLAGRGLVLEYKRGAATILVPISGAGRFVFILGLPSGADYALEVQTQPSSPVQHCVITNGSGRIGTASVTDVAVVCADVNEAVAENALPGTSAWGLTNPAAGREIEGYASATSVNRGDTLALYVNTAASAFQLEIFRTGWYKGLGARRIYGPVNLPGQVQAIPSPDPTTRLVDCNWIASYQLQTRDATTGRPWPTGVYLARLTESGGGRQAYIIFVVRDDDLRPDILFQLPITTYQAYNFWGGASLYSWGSGSALPWGSTAGTAAFKVSFNRPYAASTNPAAAYGNGAGDYLTNVSPVAQGYPISSAGWDYNMVRWLEQQGYNVAYSTNIDTHVSAAAVRNTSVFMSHGHDEYWTWAMRANVQAARDAGVNLAFFSGNTSYWQIRLEASPATGAANRVIVCYKSASADPYYTDSDPSNNKYVTVRWRDPPVSLPEESLIGSQYVSARSGDLIVSNASYWVFAGTGVANQDHIAGLLGYEVNGRFGSEPANTVTLTSTPLVSHPTGRPGEYSQMTIYSAASGARVFSTGSIQWSWGLDDFNAPALRTSRLSQTAITITRNVLSAFGAQPSPPPPVSTGLERRHALPTLDQREDSGEHRLRTGFWNAARLMGSSDKYGTVAPGEIADLVLQDTDPLVDIHNTTKVSAVLLAGKYFDRPVLDQMLRDAEVAAADSAK